jgi:ubiquinone/menaquinone biosynthesis C-methylase UbiE
MFLDDPASFVRAGRSVAAESGTVSAENPIWVKFARAMAPMMAMPAELLAEQLLRGGAPRRVLDIAAGHGLFGIAVAKRVAASELVALDWPKVLEVAAENAAKAVLGSRFRRLAGSAFETSFGGPYDLVLVANFLHHFDAATCVAVLEKCRAALAPGGRVAILEFVPESDRVSPPLAASFAYVMLATTPSGDAYTRSELEDMARRAGFARCEFAPLPPSPQTLLTLYP